MNLAYLLYQKRSTSDSYKLHVIYYSENIWLLL